MATRPIPFIAAAAPAIAGGTPVRPECLVFGSPLIRERDCREVLGVLQSGWLGTGPRVERFEAAFADYVGGRHGVAVSSCTAALHLSLKAAGIGPGDEVIVPAMTFVATANSVVHAGAVPILCDVDPTTQNITAALVAPHLTRRTRAILPVHFAGRAVDLTGLLELASDRRILVVNDAAHAIETEHRGRRIGGLGMATAYSFYPTKNITTGEGGMVVTDDDRLAARLRTLRQHGLSADAWKRYSAAGFRHYEAVEPGFKANMTDLQAALGLQQLARIEEMSRRRRRIWTSYGEAFSGLPMTLPAGAEPGDRHALHLYTVLLHLEALSADRDTIARALLQEGIGTGVHYRAVHLHPYYRDTFGYAPDAFPHAARISDRTLSLPLSARLSDLDVADVIEAVHKVVEYFRR
jgi:dTDP-4-amino-4,6-dideoxygalactose transaminase